MSPIGAAEGAETVKQRKRREDQCRNRVDGGNLPQAGRRIKKLRNRVNDGDRSGDPRRHIERAKPPRHVFGIASRPVSDVRKQTHAPPFEQLIRCYSNSTSLRRANSRGGLGIADLPVMAPLRHADGR
jgi:hypothetical protein